MLKEAAYCLVDRGGLLSSYIIKLNLLFIVHTVCQVLGHCVSHF